MGCWLVLDTDFILSLAEDDCISMRDTIYFESDFQSQLKLKTISMPGILGPLESQRDSNFSTFLYPLLCIHLEGARGTFHITENDGVQTA